MLTSLRLCTRSFIHFNANQYKATLHVGGVGNDMNSPHKGGFVPTEKSLTHPSHKSAFRGLQINKMPATLAS